MHQFDLLYEKFKAYRQRYRFAPKRAETDLDELLEEFQKTLGGYHKEVDRSNINSCLEGTRLLKNFQWHNLVKKEGHILAFLDFFTREELSILFNVRKGTLDARMANLLRKGRSPRVIDPSISDDPDQIGAMSEDEFNREMELNVRLKALAIIKDEKVNQGTVELIKQVLITSRERKIENVGKMFNLLRKLLTWFTGAFLPAFTKKVAYVLKVPHERIQILAAEVLDDEYAVLVREFKEIKVEDNVPLDNLVKKAKRRGKLKWTRKAEEKEEKLLRASSSTAPNEAGNAESPFKSASETSAS